MKKMILCIISGLLIIFCVSAKQTTSAIEIPVAMEDESAVKHEFTQPTTNTLQSSLIKGKVGTSLYALQKLLVSSQEQSQPDPKTYINALAISDYMSWYFSLNLDQAFSKDRSDLIISTYECIDKLYPPAPGAKNMSEIYKDGIIKEADTLKTKFPPWSVNDEK